MDEIKAIEKVIYKLKKNHQYQEVYGLTKRLYESDNASDKMGIIYGQSLLLDGKPEEANRIFEKYYIDNSQNVELLLCLFQIAFEKYDFEGALAYLEELKPFVNKNLFKKLIPFEIYLREVNGLEANAICHTKTTIYLLRQIKKYSDYQAIKFIKDYNLNNAWGFTKETNFEALFYEALHYVLQRKKENCFNPFKLDIDFFDKYYMDISHYSLTYTPFKYAKISTLPFSNHICMISPTTKKYEK